MSLTYTQIKIEFDATPRRRFLEYQTDQSVRLPIKSRNTSPVRAKNIITTTLNRTAPHSPIQLPLAKYINEKKTRTRSQLQQTRTGVGRTQKITLDLIPIIELQQGVEDIDGIQYIQ
ncbi:Hypothetical_protein [Hexamita inflata]|uniref:Hypothetical_protein n=1 Tax=Hexamita inflata TaxID=28002 RepID=A0AA86QJ46_9EUKA|nr:Hypothetical protein HINF_LOCUS43148 [Hexamita inflata]